MSTALELYKQAYDLDYNKGDVHYAETLYKEIISRFPHSDEKEYSQVHLDRIARLKGNPGDPAFSPVKHPRGATGLAIACFALLLPLMLAVGFGFYFGYRHYQRMESLESVLCGMLCEKNNDTAGAVEQYTRAQQSYSAGGMAFRCLAELYLRGGKITQAALVGRQWELLAPDDINLADFKRRLVEAGRKEPKP
jgi:hypothetical protein